MQSHNRLFNDARQAMESLITEIENLEQELDKTNDLNFELEGRIEDKDNIIKELRLELSKAGSEIN